MESITRKLLPAHQQQVIKTFKLSLDSIQQRNLPSPSIDTAKQLASTLFFHETGEMLFATLPHDLREKWRRLINTPGTQLVPGIIAFKNQLKMIQQAITNMDSPITVPDKPEEENFADIFAMSVYPNNAYTAFGETLKPEWKAFMEEVLRYLRHKHRQGRNVWTMEDPEKIQEYERMEVIVERDPFKADARQELAGLIRPFLESQIGANVTGFNKTLRNIAFNLSKVEGPFTGQNVNLAFQAAKVNLAKGKPGEIAGRLNQASISPEAQYIGAIPQDSARKALDASILRPLAAGESGRAAPGSAEGQVLSGMAREQSPQSANKIFGLLHEYFAALKTGRPGADLTRNLASAAEELGDMDISDAIHTLMSEYDQGIYNLQMAVCIKARATLADFTPEFQIAISRYERLSGMSADEILRRYETGPGPVERLQGLDQAAGRLESYFMNYNLYFGYYRGIYSINVLFGMPGSYIPVNSYGLRNIIFVDIIATWTFGPDGTITEGKTVVGGAAGFGNEDVLVFTNIPRQATIDDAMAGAIEEAQHKFDEWVIHTHGLDPDKWEDISEYTALLQILRKLINKTAIRAELRNICNVAQALKDPSAFILSAAGDPRVIEKVRTFSEVIAPALKDSGVSAEDFLGDLDDDNYEIDDRLLSTIRDRATGSLIYYYAEELGLGKMPDFPDIAALPILKYGEIKPKAILQDLASQALENSVLRPVAAGEREPDLRTGNDVLRGVAAKYKGFLDYALLEIEQALSIGEDGVSVIENIFSGLDSGRYPAQEINMLRFFVIREFFLIRDHKLSPQDARELLEKSEPGSDYPPAYRMEYCMLLGRAYLDEGDKLYAAGVDKKTVMRLYRDGISFLVKAGVRIKEEANRLNGLRLADMMDVKRWEHDLRVLQDREAERLELENVGDCIMIQVIAALDAGAEENYDKYVPEVIARGQAILANRQNVVPDILNEFWQSMRRFAKKLRGGPQDAYLRVIYFLERANAAEQIKFIEKTRKNMAEVGGIMDEMAGISDYSAPESAGKIRQLAQAAINLLTAYWEPFGRYGMEGRETYRSIEMASDACARHVEELRVYLSNIILDADPLSAERDLRDRARPCVENINGIAARFAEVISWGLLSSYEKEFSIGPQGQLINWYVLTGRRGDGFDKLLPHIQYLVLSNVEPDGPQMREMRHFESRAGHASLLGKRGPGVEEYRKLPRAGHILCILSRREGRIVGYLLSDLRTDHAEILDMAVLPEYIIQGVEVELTDTLKRRAEGDDYEFISVSDINGSNDVAMKFLEAAEFKTARIIRNQFGEGEHGYRMIYKTPQYAHHQANLAPLPRQSSLRSLLESILRPRAAKEREKVSELSPWRIVPDSGDIIMGDVLRSDPLLHPFMTLQDIKRLAGIFSNEAAVDAAELAWHIIRAGAVRVPPFISTENIAEWRITAKATYISLDDIPVSRQQIKQQYSAFVSEMAAKGIRFPSFETCKRFLMLLTEAKYPGYVIKSQWPVTADFPTRPRILIDFIVRWQLAERSLGSVAARLAAIFEKGKDIPTGISCEYVTTILGGLSYEQLYALMNLSMHELLPGAEGENRQLLSNIDLLDALLRFFRMHKDELRSQLLGYHNDLRGMDYFIEETHRRLQRFLNDQPDAAAMLGALPQRPALSSAADNAIMSSILRPLAAGEDAARAAVGKDADFDKDKISDIFAAMEDYALRLLKNALGAEIRLIPAVLKLLPKEPRLEGARELLRMTYDGLMEVKWYLELDPVNFPGLDVRRQTQRALLDILRPRCVDVETTLNIVSKLPGLSDRLRHEFNMLSLFNGSISKYADLYASATYFIDNGQILGDFTKWLSRTENSRHADAFDNLFYASGIEWRVSRDLPRPIRKIFFLEGSMKYFDPVINAVSEFFASTTKRAAPILGELRDRTATSVLRPRAVGERGRAALSGMAPDLTGDAAVSGTDEDGGISLEALDRMLSIPDITIKELVDVVIGVHREGLDWEGVRDRIISRLAAIGTEDIVWDRIAEFRILLDARMGSEIPVLPEPRVDVAKRELSNVSPKSFPKSFGIALQIKKEIKRQMEHAI
ncbi:MAG: hypothetical protein HY589_05220 [Candidatus Omnitrophica bacterium]|nr:hypothetical protein [Candidatus Omnitrophota bacterium]